MINEKMEGRLETVERLLEVWKREDWSCNAIRERGDVNLSCDRGDNRVRRRENRHLEEAFDSVRMVD